MNIGAGAGGALGGLIASTRSPNSFVALLLVNAATYVAYALVLFWVPSPARAQADMEQRVASYRCLLRVRPVIVLVVAEVFLVAVGYGTLSSVVPVFARNKLAVSERAIGLVFLLNTLAIVTAQLPIARIVEGTRRLRALALCAFTWSLSCLVVLSASFWFVGTPAAVVLGLPPPSASVRA